MSKYHKINSVFKRETGKTNKGKFTEEYSTAEIEFLSCMEWVGTEKIDGMNIRLSKSYGIMGRTDNAMIPPKLLKKLENIVLTINWELIKSDDVVFYGEGYGAKIQSGGNYIRDDMDFILFDIAIDGRFVSREVMLNILSSLGSDIKVVPILFTGCLKDAITYVSVGFKSTIGIADAEGLVLTPKVGLLDNRGHRIITKLKTKDFR